jgi:hypothetical protein
MGVLFPVSFLTPERNLCFARSVNFSLRPPRLGVTFLGLVDLF